MCSQEGLNVENLNLVIRRTNLMLGGLQVNVPGTQCEGDSSSRKCKYLAQTLSGGELV